jgi:hypothetical protein
MAPDHASPIFCVKPVQMRSPCTPANLFWSGIAIAVTMMLISFILNVIAAVRDAGRSRQDLP